MKKIRLDKIDNSLVKQFDFLEKKKALLLKRIEIYKYRLDKIELELENLREK